MVFSLRNNGVLDTVMRINPNGTIKTKYGQGLHLGNPAYILGVNAQGDIVEATSGVEVVAVLSIMVYNTGYLITLKTVPLLMICQQSQVTGH